MRPRLRRRPGGAPARRLQRRLTAPGGAPAEYDRLVELRRALLLFATVLILAALVSTIANPPQRGGEETVATTPAPAPSASSGSTATTPVPLTVTFPAGGRALSREIEQGQAAAVLVEVAAAAEVAIPSLGLTGTAEPLTPARFDVLVDQPGEHEIIVSPASGSPPSVPAGTLRVVAPS